MHVERVKCKYENSLQGGTCQGTLNRNRDTLWACRCAVMYAVLRPPVGGPSEGCSQRQDSAHVAEIFLATWKWHLNPNLCLLWLDN